MEQLEINLSAFLGLTPWLSGNPPFVGWWETRRPTVTPDRRPIEGERRWWNGFGWSAPIYVGDPDDAILEAALRNGPLAPPGAFEYRGLSAPAPHYDWALDPHHREALASAIRPRVKLIED